MTAHDAIQQAAGRLAAAGVPEPRLDAERLLRHVTGWDAAALLVHSRDAIAEDDEQRFQELVAQRVRRRPMQHLTGLASFWRHELRVTSDVLIPRPETEHLVEAALERLKGVERPVIVDVGTGSGCIALAIAAERPDAIVHAVDLSPAALSVARDNAARVGVADRVVFHEGDLLGPLQGQRVDLVVSNPPYVGADEVETLAPEVRDHDPRMALVPPGGDPFSIYRRLATEGRDVLRPGGALMVEIGQGMEDEVRRIFTSAALAVERTVRDLQSIPRVVIATVPDRGNSTRSGTS